MVHTEEKDIHGKVRQTIWLDPEVLTRAKQIAAEENLSVSQVLARGARNGLLGSKDTLREILEQDQDSYLRREVEEYEATRTTSLAS